MYYIRQKIVPRDLQAYLFCGVGLCFLVFAYFLLIFCPIVACEHDKPLKRCEGVSLLHRDQAMTKTFHFASFAFCYGDKQGRHIAIPCRHFGSKKCRTMGVTCNTGASTSL